MVSQCLNHFCRFSVAGESCRIDLLLSKTDNVIPTLTDETFVAQCRTDNIKSKSKSNVFYQQQKIQRTKISTAEEVEDQIILTTYTKHTKTK